MTRMQANAIADEDKHVLSHPGGWNAEDGWRCLASVHAPNLTDAKKILMRPSFSLVWRREWEPVRLSLFAPKSRLFSAATARG